MNENKLSVEQQAKMDSLVASCKASIMRRDYREAADFVSKALEIDPKSFKLRELAADVAALRGFFSDAINSYRELMDENKSDELEEKYAKAVLHKSNDEYMVKHAGDVSADVYKKSPVMAAIFSVVPGFGQIYCGETVRGLVIFVIVIVSWILFSATAPAIGSYGDMGMRMDQFLRGLNFFAIIFILAATCVHVYAAVEAVLLAQKS